MFLGGLFSPFTPRFAHFRADNDMDGLQKFFTSAIHLTFPIVLIPIVVATLLSKQFVIAWSGPTYIDAVPLTILFILLNVFASFNYVGGSIVTVFEKTKLLRKLAFILPVIYWIGIFVLPHSLKIISFGIMKQVVFLIIIISYTFTSINILHVEYKDIIYKLAKYNAFPMISVTVLSLLLSNKISVAEKGFHSLVQVCGTILCICIVGYVFTFFTNKEVNTYAKSLYRKIRRP